MTINWGALGVVAAVSLAVGLAVVVLVSLALVGLSARAAAEPQGRLSPGAGTAVAALCLAAASAIVLYGFYLLIF
jgi:hypothetical protein